MRVQVAVMLLHVLKYLQLSHNVESEPSLTQGHPSAHSMQQQHGNVAVAQEQEWEEEYEEEEDQPGLFQRVASRLSARDEERPSRTRTRHMEVASNNPDPVQEPEHDLEIPAFLRRQAN